MASSPELKKTIRQCMDVFTTRAIHDWSRYVKASGLSMPLFGILMHLYYRKSSSVSHLSEYLDISNAASSQLVDRLVQNGLVARTEEPKNRRAKHLTLTPKGLALIQAGLGTRHIWVDALMEQLSPEECGRVQEGLDILAQHLQHIQAETEI